MNNCERLEQSPLGTEARASNPDDRDTAGALRLDAGVSKKRWIDVSFFLSEFVARFAHAALPKLSEKDAALVGRLLEAIAVSYSLEDGSDEQLAADDIVEPLADQVWVRLRGLSISPGPLPSHGPGSDAMLAFAQSSETLRAKDLLRRAAPALRDLVERALATPVDPNAAAQELPKGTRAERGAPGSEPQRLVEVAIEEIQLVGGRLRRVGSVDALMQSIREQGLLSPILVTSDLRLVAGAHRLEACRRLGHATILARLLPLDDLRATLAEIDENLVHSCLSALEEAEHLELRKEIYEKLNPGRRHGGARKATSSDQDPDSGSFLDVTARLTGRGRATIAEAVQIGKMPKTVRDAVRGTPVADHKGNLLALARLPKSDQARIARELKAGTRTSVKEPKIKSKTDADATVLADPASAAPSVGTTPAPDHPIDRPGTQLDILGALAAVALRVESGEIEMTVLREAEQLVTELLVAIKAMGSDRDESRAVRAVCAGERQ